MIRGSLKIPKDLLPVRANCPMGQFLKPAPQRVYSGHTYDIKVSYIDDTYNLAIGEKHPREPKARNIAPRGIGACAGIQARLE